jgi:hypothetical protein
MHDSLVFALVAKILVCVPPPLLGQLMDGFGGKAIESSGIQIQLLLYPGIDCYSRKLVYSFSASTSTNFAMQWHFL